MYLTFYPAIYHSYQNHLFMFIKAPKIIADTFNTSKYFTGDLMVKLAYRSTTIITGID